jgi:pimeloyl-ACP methyl ester carboxylesterase
VTNAPLPIRNWVWLFSGFRQSLLALTGIETLWRQLRGLADHETSIQYRPWDTDPKGVAQFIARNSEREIDHAVRKDPRIVLIGYSWGGDCAFDVAVALKAHGLAVCHLVLCDAVHRSGIFSTRFPLNPLSLTRFPKFVIPDNVQRVTAFCQRNDRPSGHRIIFQGEECSPTWVTSCGHVGMDECEDFHVAAEDAIAEILTSAAMEAQAA